MAILNWTSKYAMSFLLLLMSSLQQNYRTGSAWKRGGRRGDGVGGGQRGEMTQTLYAHMNKRIVKTK
jgi:hypothetical protein